MAIKSTHISAMLGTFGRSNREKERRGVHFCKSHARKELKKSLEEVLLGSDVEPAAILQSLPDTWSLCLFQEWVESRDKALLFIKHKHINNFICLNTGVMHNTVTFV